MCFTLGVRRFLFQAALQKILSTCRERISAAPDPASTGRASGYAQAERPSIKPSPNPTNAPKSGFRIAESLPPSYSTTHPGSVLAGTVGDLVEFRCPGLDSCHDDATTRPPTRGDSNGLRGDGPLDRRPASQAHDSDADHRRDDLRGMHCASAVRTAIGERRYSRSGQARGARSGRDLRSLAGHRGTDDQGCQRS